MNFSFLRACGAFQIPVFITYLAIEKNFVIRKFSHFRICLRFCHWNSNLSFDSFDLAFQIRICHNKKIHSTVKNFSQKMFPPPTFRLAPYTFRLAPQFSAGEGILFFDFDALILYLAITQRRVYKKCWTF